jgi:hypothetical protein
MTDRAVNPTLRFLALALGLLLTAAGADGADREPIDRRAVVVRHNPILRAFDPDAPVTVGNGNFAFGCDVTGLQTFAAEHHRNGVPVETLSRWCWVTDENAAGHVLADTHRDFRLADGRGMAFPVNATSPAGEWLRRNPRSHPLAQLALVRRDGNRPLHPADLSAIEQSLDLWSGIVTSRFRVDGEELEVTTVCHGEEDTLGFRLAGPALAARRLAVRLAFPRGHDPAVKNTPALDWSHPEAHRSDLRTPFDNRGGGWIGRRVGSTRYGVVVEGAVTLEREGPHAFVVLPVGDGDTRAFEFCVRFVRDDVPPAASGPAFADVHQASAARWERYWRRGGAADFSGSSNPLARRIEERIVLSRYLTAVQLAGDVPPQESGLTCNTWYGKHHTEMIWWHAAHFALWGHDDLLERNLAWYVARLPEARALAASRGLEGARWAKMVGPDMRESPGGNPLIVWNQPHPIYLAELLYRGAPGPEILGRYRSLVLETAAGLASMVWLDPARGQYVLGPPLWIAQEIHDPATSQNPAFELAYWRWALETAQRWRGRLGMPREERWDEVLARLAPLPRKDGRYVALESHPDTWDTRDSRHDHPSMLAPLGVLPGGPDVDRPTMVRTLDAVLREWDWETKIWGWDYPMIAMTAARLGRPETALEILLREGPNNRYLPTGHCPQRSDERLSPSAPPGARRREIATYLPANGAFLSAVALMLAGWDGAEGEHPGFPRDGSWTIRTEGLRPLP